MDLTGLVKGLYENGGLNSGLYGTPTQQSYDWYQQNVVNQPGYVPNGSNVAASPAGVTVGGGSTTANPAQTSVDPYKGNVVSASTGAVTGSVGATGFTPAPAAQTPSLPTAQVATPTGYTANTWNPTGDALVENRIAGLLNQNNPYMQAARTSGLQTAQARGLLNSSMAGEAAQAAAIKAAFPIASQDATTFGTAGMANQNATNEASKLSAELGSRQLISDNTLRSQENIARANNESSQLTASAAIEATQLANMGSTMAELMAKNNAAVNAINTSDMSPEDKQAQIYQIEVGTRNASAAALAVYGLGIEEILGLNFGV